jgi:hypothetical protein
MEMKLKKLFTKITQMNTTAVPNISFGKNQA